MVLPDYTRNGNPESEYPFAEQKNLVVRYPDLGEGSVEDGTTKLLIIREDTEFATDPIVQRLCDSYLDLDTEIVRAVIGEEYDGLMQTLVTQYAKAMPQDKLEVHLFPPGKLEQKVREYTDGCLTASLDPLSPGDVDVQMTRAHIATVKLGLRHKNGSQPMDHQLARVKDLWESTGKPVALIDDDLYGGSTSAELYRKMNSMGVPVNRFIFGCRVGEGKVLQDAGIMIASAVDYARVNQDVNTDLVDTRDFAFGYDGMSVVVPGNRDLGRVPAMLPFFQTSVDTIIPPEAEIDFSNGMWEVNIQHFYNIQNRLGVQLSLKHMHPDVYLYMEQMHGFNEEMSMTDLTEWIYENQEDLWIDTQRR